jgi:FAD/FMN-containing dehydrogenase
LLDAGDLHVVDDIGHALDIANDPQDLVEDVDRLDLARHVDLRAGDGDPQPVAGRDVGRAERLDDVGAQLVVARRKAVVDLDGIVAFEFAGIGRIGPGDVDARRLARLRHDPVGRRGPGHPLFGGDQRIIGHPLGRLVHEVALVLGWQRLALVSLLHTDRVGKSRAASISAVSLVARLAEIVGPSHCLTDPDLRASYETDWTRRWQGVALAVVRPGSTDEVAAVLRACADGGVGVVPQGGNTGLVGGSVPRDGEVVLSLLRLDAVEDVDPDAGEMTVGAGVTLAAAQSAARTAGWEVGIDFGARDTATIGGMVATNAGGVNVLRHGPMRRQVGGFEAVLADGTVLRRLPGMPKDNTGYDLGGLLAGSEGTLAVITRVGLRLVAPLARRAVGVIGLDSPAAAVAVAGRLRRELASLLALELFTDAGLELVMRHGSVAAPFAARRPVYLLVEAGSDETDPTDDLAAALDTLGAGEAAAVASDPAGRHRLWQLRERHTEAMNVEGVPHKLDVSVPLARYAELVERAPEAVSAIAPSARTIVYGHVGDGNLHVNVLGPAPDDERCDAAVLELVLELGGSVSAEHGIGVAKVEWLVRDRGPEAVAAMRAIKRALDPNGTLNPGVLLARSLRSA